MPKKMFFNISEEKRKMFIESAMSEFTSKSFEQVSVNTIVKKAGISRGSFYTYFDDLESLFNYLFTSIKEERFTYGRKILLEVKGDYFEFVRRLFVYDFDNFQTEKKYSLFRNYIHYVQTIKRGSIKDYILKEVLKELELNDIDVEKHIKSNSYGLSKNELLDVFEIVVLIMINTLIKGENESLSKDEVISLFQRRLDYIEHGVKKRVKS